MQPDELLLTPLATILLSDTMEITGEIQEGALSNPRGGIPDGATPSSFLTYLPHHVADIRLPAQLHPTLDSGH